MPKDEWGVKRLCPSCSTRFYDLQHDPMTCPSCGASFDLQSLLSKKSGSRPEKKEESARPASTKKAETAVVLDDQDGESGVEVEDDLLENEEDEDTVDLEEIADVPAKDDET